MTSNLPFSKWESIFKDAMTTAAAIDRLVHHSVILELNLPSYPMFGIDPRPPIPKSVFLRRKRGFGSQNPKKRSDTIHRIPRILSLMSR